MECKHKQSYKTMTRVYRGFISLCKVVWISYEYVCFHNTQETQKLALLALRGMSFKRL